MDKNWIGNYNSIFKTLGASSHVEHDREVNDYYATHPNALNLFLDEIKDTDLYSQLSKNIWENAVGEGHLAQTLKERGFNVYASDLVDRGFEDFHMLDFLGATERPFEEMSIITNPPYKYATEFLNKSLELLKDKELVIMFLKIQFLEGKARHKIFKENPPKYVYVNSTRQSCAMNGEFYDDKGKIVSSAVCYCWYVWEKGFKGDTIIRWLP